MSVSPAPPRLTLMTRAGVLARSLHERSAAEQREQLRGRVWRGMRTQRLEGVNAPPRTPRQHDTREACGDCATQMLLIFALRF